MKPFQNSKEALVRECLTKTPLAIALRFKNGENEEGFLFASKSKHSGAPWFPIDAPEKTVGGHAHYGAKKTRQVGLVVGIGNRSELLKVIEIYKNIVYAEADDVGLHSKFDNEVVEGLAEALNTEYRANNPAVPYRVELMVMSFSGKTLELTRVKADGDMHSLEGFGVIGGYETYRGPKKTYPKEEKDTPAGYKVSPRVQDDENVETVRHVALGILQLTYSTHIPTLDGAQELVELIMALDGEAYPYNFRAAIGVEPDEKPAKTPKTPKVPETDEPTEPGETPPRENPEK